MTEHVLTWRKNLPPPGNDDAPLHLIDMPRGLSRPKIQILAAEALEAEGRAVLLEVLAALRASARPCITRCVMCRSDRRAMPLTSLRR